MTFVKNATGQKNARVRLQTYIETLINQVKYPIVFVVIQNLIKPVIIGADFLDAHGADVSFKRRVVVLTGVTDNLVPFRPVEVVEDDSDVKCDDVGVVSAVSALSVNDSVSVTLEQLQDKAASACVSEDVREGLLQVLIKHRRTFDARPGLTDKYVHQIKLHDYTPFVKRPYPVPMALRPAVEEVLREMEALGVIKRAASAFASPMSIAKKKDGSVRICLDARVLNDRMLSEAEAPLATEELLHAFSGVKFLSTIDLRLSYWQIPLDEDSKQYTAFLYNGRSYVYQVLPFGLKTAVASFSRAMDLILGPEVREFCVNYIDDLLIASRTLEEHLQHLDIVLTKLGNAKMTANLDKTHLFKSEVQFLGHLFSAEGVRADPSKVDAIRKFPTPQNRKQLRGFLGLCNYYRKFSDKYSAETTVLNKLLKKTSSWRWGREEEVAFNTVKDLFLDTVMLKHPDYNRRFYVQTDGSGYAVGAELFQISECGDRGVIAFASRTLRGAELHYTTTEKELLGIVFALQKFRTIILGQEIVIRTDHQALTFLKRCRLLNNRLTRWVLFIEQFDYTIEHVKGSENVVADVLSRFPYDRPDIAAGPTANEVVVAVFETENADEVCSELKGLRSNQEQDAVFGPIIEHLVSGNPTDEFPKEVKRLLPHCELHNDVLVYRHNEDRNAKLIIPASLTEKVILHFHQAMGHFGASKLHVLMKETFYWPSMLPAIKAVTRKCDLCQRTKYLNKRSEGERNPVLTKDVGELVTVDFYGPLPKGHGAAQYIFVVIDSFSKFVKLYPLRSAKATIAARRLTEDYGQYMKIRTVLSDHGSQFTSKKWSEICSKAGITTTFSSIRHPQSNPTERVMKELGRIFRAYCSENHAGWVKHLSKIEECFNKLPHVITGFSPHKVLYGRDPPAPLDTYVNKMLPTRRTMALKDIRKEVQKNLRHAAELRKKYGPKAPTVFHTGDLVLLRTNPVSNAGEKVFGKFLPLYEGPFRVESKPHPNTYKLKDPVTTEVRGVFNVTNLRKYFQ